MVLGSDHLHHPFICYTTEVRCRIKQMFVVDHQWIEETHLIQELIRNLVNQKYCIILTSNLKSILSKSYNSTGPRT